MIISTLSDVEWNKAVADCAHQTAFHDAGMARAFTEEFGGRVTFFQIEAESLMWLVPVFSGSPWSPDGCFATSSIGYGGPLPQSDRGGDAYYEAELACLRIMEAHLNLKFHRGTLFPCDSWTAQSGLRLSETIVVELAATKEETFRSILQGNVRTAVRRAWKNGLDVKTVEDDDELDWACRLIEGTQYLVGAKYTTPARLIERVHFDEELPGELFITTWQGKPISAGMLLNNPFHSFHWLHGWDRAHAALCGNQLLIWTMMSRCLSQGCRKLNLGFCHTKEQKCAKQRWGGTVVPVPTLLTAKDKNYGG